MCVCVCVCVCVYVRACEEGVELYILALCRYCCCCCCCCRNKTSSAMFSCVMTNLRWKISRTWCLHLTSIWRRTSWNSFLKRPGQKLVHLAKKKTNSKTSIERSGQVVIGWLFHLECNKIITQHNTTRHDRAEQSRAEQSAAQHRPAHRVSNISNFFSSLL